MAGDASDGPGPPSPPRPPDPVATATPAQDPGAPATAPPPPLADETTPPAATNIAMATHAPQGWDPEVTQRIKDTMAKTWSAPLGYAAVYPLHEDAHLRAMTEDEARALDAYMSGKLDLPAPPTFLTCTMPALKRAAILAYHHRHIEVTLVANVGARLRVGKYIMKKAILRELLAANGQTDQGQRMMKRLMTDALRIAYDGMNTMSFVFPSKRVAQPWEGAALKFRAGALVLASAKTDQPGVRPPPQLAQHYAVNVLGVASLDPIAVMTIFNHITGDRVLDIRQRGLDGLNEADNDYWTIIFADLDCPAALRGVTCILVEDSKLYLHHYKRTPMAPCKRCLNPNHVASRCKVLPSELTKTRAYRQRLYTGQSPTIIDFSPQDYTGLDFVASDLDNLLRTQMTSGPASDTGKAPLELVQVEQPCVNSTTEAGAARNSGASQEQLPDDGYRLQRKKKKDRAPKAAMPTAEPRAERGDSAEGSSRQQADGRTSSLSKPETQSRSGRLVSAEVPTDAPKQQRSKRGSMKPNPAKQFARFAQLAASERYRQTREAYALLEGDDEDEDLSMDEASVSGDDQDENLITEADTGDTREVEPMDIDRNMPTLLEEATDGQRTSDNISSTESTGHEELVHLQQGTAQEEYERSRSDDCDGMSATSDDETVSVLRERKRVEQAFAECYGQWLAAGNGHEVAVGISGQSMYSAYYVTTGNMTCKRWRPDADDLHQINQIKERVLNVLLANLRYDIHLELVDPVKVVARLYPNVKRPTSIAAAGTKLYAHFAADRTVCASATIDSRTRAAQLELRALAVFTREPVYVWKKGEGDFLGVDQYTRHVYTMPNGDKHETGIVVAMSPEMVATLLHECSAAHVVPIMLLYNESTCQYAGMSYGQLFDKWDNQPGTTMRQRLDGVHRKLHFEVLDGSPLDYEALALEATEEEESILDELGLDVYSCGSRKQQTADASSNMLLKRAPVSRATQVHEEVYSRILQEDSSQKMSAIDARVAEKLHRCNGQAFKKWMTKQGSKMGLLKNAAKYEDTDTWPCEHSKAMRLLFGFLPFPELAAQKLPMDRLIEWGEHEASNHLKRVLERIRDDVEQADEAHRPMHHLDCRVSSCKQAHCSFDGTGYCQVDGTK